LSAGGVGTSVASRPWELAWTLARTDFKVRYHGTLGGFVWALLKPLAMFLVLLVVFSFAFGAKDPNYKLRLILGLFLWDFFAEGTKVGLLSLHAKGYVLAKARFPSWIVVVTSPSNAFITLVVFGSISAIFLALSGRLPAPELFPLIFIYMAAYVAVVIGFSLGASVLFLRYRDLNQVWEVVLQAGFFVAPIIYPLGIMPERFHFWLYLWPPTPVIQFCRSVLIDGVIPSARAHVLLLAQAGAILLAGIAVYRRYAGRAAEYL
jgi:ABC-type polysaccharide/polyol phosphate export permease